MGLLLAYELEWRSILPGSCCILFAEEFIVVYLPRRKPRVRIGHSVLNRMGERSRVQVKEVEMRARHFVGWPAKPGVVKGLAPDVL